MKLNFLTAAVTALLITAACGAMAQSTRAELVQRIAVAQGLTDLIDQQLVQTREVARANAAKLFDQAVVAGQANPKELAVLHLFLAKAADLISANEIAAVWVTHYGDKFGVSFHLAGRRETFVYSTRGREKGVIETGLSAPNGAAVSLLVDPEARRRWFSQETYVDVWQLSIHDRMVRSTRDKRASDRLDIAFGHCMTIALVLATVYFAAMARRIRNRARRLGQVRQSAE